LLFDKTNLLHPKNALLDACLIRDGFIVTRDEEMTEETAGDEEDDADRSTERRRHGASRIGINIPS